MTRKTYIDLLRDPRWQKKRLEILQRDEFSCVECGDGTSTLHVHHGFYKPDAMPWDYPSGSLTTLCEACHDLEGDAKLFKKYMLDCFASEGWLATDFFNILSAIKRDDPKIIKNPWRSSILEWVLINEDVQNSIIKMYAEHLSKKKGASKIA